MFFSYRNMNFTIFLVWPVALNLNLNIQFVVPMYTYHVTDAVK